MTYLALFLVSSLTYLAYRNIALMRRHRQQTAATPSQEDSEKPSVEEVEREAHRQRYVQRLKTRGFSVDEAARKSAELAQLMPLEADNYFTTLDRLRMIADEVSNYQDNGLAMQAVVDEDEAQANVELRLLRRRHALLISARDLLVEEHVRLLVVDNRFDEAEFTLKEARIERDRRRELTKLMARIMALPQEAQPEVRALHKAALARINNPREFRLAITAVEQKLGH